MILELETLELIGSGGVLKSYCLQSSQNILKIGKIPVSEYSNNSEYSENSKMVLYGKDGDFVAAIPICWKSW